MLLSDCLNFSRYWTICVSKLIVNKQAVRSQNLKLTLLLESSCFAHHQKSRQKYLWNEKSLWGEIKVFFIIFKGLSIVKNCLRPQNASLSFSGNHCTKNEVFLWRFPQYVWPNPQETVDLVIFTDDILHGKLHCLFGEYKIIAILHTFEIFVNSSSKMLLLVQGMQHAHCAKHHIFFGILPPKSSRIK